MADVDDPDYRPPFPTRIPTPQQLQEAVECGINECMPEVMSEMELVIIQHMNEIKDMLPSEDKKSEPSFKSGVWIGISIGGALFVGLLVGLFVGTLV